QPVASKTGSPLFCVHLLKDLVLHRKIRHQSLESANLLLIRTQLACLAHFQPTILALPPIVSRLANVVLRTKRFHRPACLAFPQYPYDLFLAESAFFHTLRAFPFGLRNLIFQLSSFAGARQLFVGAEDAGWISAVLYTIVRSCWNVSVTGAAFY